MLFHINPVSSKHTFCETAEGRLTCLPSVITTYLRYSFVRRRRIFQSGEGLDLGLQVCRLVGRYQPLGRTVLPQWILNTEAAAMSETPVTAYQTSRRYKVENHTQIFLTFIVVMPCTLFLIIRAFFME